MNFKVKNLTKKIFKDFITGKYGQPKIPSESELILKLEEFSSTEYKPVSKISQMKDIDIETIRNTMNSIIDDIDVLYDSIESESRSVLDQLTNSLEEHRGVKRELRNIDVRTDDINEGKLGVEYLKYNFTEKFNDLKNINLRRSDPVNVKAGVFNIRPTNANVLTLQHYYGKKLQVNITDYFGTIIDDSFVGTTDIRAIVDPDDSRGLTYRIRTNQPTSLKMNFTFQLAADNRPVEINKVVFDLDSEVNKGAIRLQYREGFEWKDIKGRSLRKVTSDRVEFIFRKTETTHLKVEFIKEGPDNKETNEYFLSLDNLSISRADAVKKAVLYSKPITLTNYSNETAVVSHLSADIKAYVPDSTQISVFVAPDSVVSGVFKNSDGVEVSPDSPSAATFDPTASGYVFLSQIVNSNDTISGLATLRSADFEWQELKSSYSNNENLPEVISFDNSAVNDPLENSLYGRKHWFLFGDQGYTGPWPQADVSPLWFASGWCNTDNAWWDPYLQGYVESGVLVSGVDVAALEGVAYQDIEDADGNLHPDILSNPNFSGQWLGYGSGYIFDFTLSDGNPLLIGQSRIINDGWFRSSSDRMEPSGISGDSADEYGQLREALINPVPDFYYNGIGFYKIYRINPSTEVIAPTIKLYYFQERPIGSENDYYPHNFLWNYKTSWEFFTKSEVNKRVAGFTNFNNYVLPLEPLGSGKEYLLDSIDNMFIYNTNVPLFKGTDFYIETEEDTSDQTTTLVPTGINLSPLQTTHSHLDASKTFFNYTYGYRQRNLFLSTWTTYAIVKNNSLVKEIDFGNPQTAVSDEIQNIIDRITIEDLDTNVVKTVSLKKNKFTIGDDLLRKEEEGDSHFKITVYCRSNDSNGFSANLIGSNTPWIPYPGKPSTSEESKSTPGRINVSPGIRLVPRLEPVRLVDIGDLVYSTTILNENKASLITDVTGDKFIVVKEPARENFPGYYFDNSTSSYSEDIDSRTYNIGHYIRKEFSLDAGSIVQYTTGSSGLYVYQSDNDAAVGSDNIDTSWNNGNINTLKKNTSNTTYYPTHTTYGFPLNLEKETFYTQNQTLKEGLYDLRAPTQDARLVGSTAWENWISIAHPSDWGNYSVLGEYSVNTSVLNRGFLYYNTGENLPAFYSITYRTLTGETDLNSRFLYKLELTSSNKNGQVPEVDSIRFSVNDEI